MAASSVISKRMNVALPPPPDAQLLEICRRPGPGGLETFRPYTLSMLAGLLVDAGESGDAMGLIDDAFMVVAPYESHWCVPEIHRQKGELLRAVSGDDAEAERCFNTALAMGEKQGAKAWELRAATSLARLKRDQGKDGEGRAVLAPIHDWYSEGFDAPEFIDAKAVLDQLG
jgi:predicted ATPase